MITEENHILEIEKLKKQIILMQQLGTTKGFFDYYFKMLASGKFKTNTECFYYVNDLYYDYFGEYRYADHDSFRKIKEKLYKK